MFDVSREKGRGRETSQGEKDHLEYVCRQIDIAQYLDDMRTPTFELTTERERDPPFNLIGEKGIKIVI